MEESLIRQDTASSFKDTILGLGVFLTYLCFGIGGFVLLVAIFKGTPWISTTIYPWAMLATAITIFVVVPLSLILAIFKRTRGVGGIGLFISSFIVGIGLWIWSLMLAYSMAGVFWMIVGVLFGGVGIVPIAIVASLLHAEWAVVIQIFILAITTYGLRGFGLTLIEKVS